MTTRSLCGQWDFCTDACGTPKHYNTQLPVPGNWKDYSAFQEYNGSAWYRRTFTISPEELKRHLSIRFGGIFRHAEIWLNGNFIEEHEGYQAPFHVDISGQVFCGENTLEVRVDNQAPVDGISNTDLFTILPISLAGIYEPVSLEISENIRISRIYAPVDLKNNTLHIILDAQNDYSHPIESLLSLEFILENCTIHRHSEPLTLFPTKNEFTISLPLDLFELWSPENPILYHISASLTVGNITDSFTVRTGFKVLEARGHEFWLNGAPYYLLGYGDDCVYPLGFPTAKDKTFYYHCIQRAKEYGFNYVRHHSHFPFEAYLDAADELGLLLQPELALANIPREQFNSENKQRFLSEWRNLILAYRHHPSIAVWCGGNEMEWGFPFDQELYNTAKTLDPYRLVSSTDGNFMACDVNDTMDFSSICPAEYTDYLPWRELNGMFLRDNSGKPQFVHEMGNYTTMPAISDLPKYQNAQAYPQKLDTLATFVNHSDKTKLYNKAYAGSLSLQKLCHKLNIEKARLSPYFCGYHVWTLTDFYENTQGILNPFYEDKAFTAEEFSRINRQEILLWDTERVTFNANETTDFIIKLSRFGSDAPLDGTLTLSLSDGHSLCTPISFSGHGLLDAYRWTVTMPSPEKESEYLLTATFRYDGGEICNSWPLFVFPAVVIDTAKEIYLHYLSRHLFEDSTVPVRHFTIPQPIGENQLIVTEFVYGGMLDAVENGASLLLLAGEKTFQNTVTANSFKSPWWEIASIWYLNHTNNRQVCGIAENHPALDTLPYYGSWKLDLFDCIEQAPAINLDALGLCVDPILYGIDLELNRYGYLFEFRLGKGRILVSTLNHSRSDIHASSVIYRIKTLINYAMSDRFSPSSTLSRKQLADALQHDMY